MTDPTAPEGYGRIEWADVREGDHLFHWNGDRMTVGEPDIEHRTIPDPDHYSVIGSKGDFEAVEYTDQKDAWQLILHKHYAKRIPPISRAFGLHRAGVQVGALTVGQPASRPLCTGLLGIDYADRVKELNRLIVGDPLPDNTLSWFVSRALRALKGTGWVIVSFADEGAGHHGYIYQATNWFYLGRSATRTDKYMPGGKHPRHYTNEFAYLRKVRTSKHKYVFAPDREMRRTIEAKLSHQFQAYPKADNSRYELGKRIEPLVLDTRTGKVHRDGPSLVSELSRPTHEEGEQT